VSVMTSWAGLAFDGDVELAQAFLLARECSHGLRDRLAQGANFGDGAAELGRTVGPRWRRPLGRARVRVRGGRAPR